MYVVTADEFPFKFSGYVVHCASHYRVKVITTLVVMCFDWYVPRCYWCFRDRSPVHPTRMYVMSLSNTAI